MAKIKREQNPDKKGNIRDYASINELICLSKWRISTLCLSTMEYHNQNVSSS